MLGLFLHRQLVKSSWVFTECPSTLSSASNVFFSYFHPCCLEHFNWHSQLRTRPMQHQRLHRWPHILHNRFIHHFLRRRGCTHSLGPVDWYVWRLVTRHWFSNWQRPCCS